MTQSHFAHADNITCENITNEVIAAYAEKGFTLVFAQKKYNECGGFHTKKVNPIIASLPQKSYTPLNNNELSEEQTQIQTLHQKEVVARPKGRQ